MAKELDGLKPEIDDIDLFLQKTVDTLPAIFYAKDLEGNFIVVNKSFENFVGEPSDKIVGKSNHDIFPKDIADQFRDNDLAIIESGTTQESIETATNADGTEQFYHSYKFPYFNEQNKIYATGGVSFNITDLKLSEQKLLAANSVLKTSNSILDLAMSNIGIEEKLTKLGELLSTSEWDNSPSKVFMLLDKFYPIQKYTFTWNCDAAELENLSSFSRKKAQFVKSDSEGLFFYYPVIHNDKLICRLFLGHKRMRHNSEIQNDFLMSLHNSIQDLIEKAYIQQELENQKKMMLHNAKLASIGELAAGVGHEINNPLAIIKGYLENLEMFVESPQTESKERADKSIQKIKKSIDRISNIVQSLRNFSRADSDDVFETNLVSIIEESIGMVSEIFKKEGIDLKFDIDLLGPSSSARIIGNEGRIVQVFMNLLTNARDATAGKEDRKIHLRLWEGSDYYYTSVFDNGTGIPEEIKERIFDPFFTTKDINAGTGIGLSLVHTIVKEHKGDITVSNLPEGGCKFLLSFNKNFKTME